jgi:hypothetical protein
VRRFLALPALSAAACLALCAGSAFASRPAHPAEQRAIARAARSAPGTQGVRGKFDVVHVRISTVDGRWARASLRPKRRYRNRFDTATAVLHLAHARWTLRTLGTADVGCAIRNHAVRRDLQLQCSSG